ncbi:MAG: DUF58 domain-containing protein [Rubrivivax sp.]
MIRAPIQRWLQSRLPVTDTWPLTQRNLYILPTKAGLSFAGTLLLMLVASINYQLNLGYLLTFLLAGVGAVSMHQTHATLRGLTLHLRAVQPVHAGQLALLDVVLDNPGRQRHGVALFFQERREGGATWDACDVPAQGQAQVRLGFVPPHRGLHAVPTVVVETVFPFGLFRAWSQWRPAAQVLAWPALETPASPLPAPSPVPGVAQRARQHHGAEFDGVRAYRRGDNLRQVVWKKAAQTGQLVSRDTRSSAAEELWLDWGLTAGDTEARLSRLAAWVLAAEQHGLPWGLRLPGDDLAPDQGEHQQRQALRRLALF